MELYSFLREEFSLLLFLLYLVISYLKNKDMEALIITLFGAGFIGLGFNLWMSYTKSGKKWLKSLG